MSTLIAITGKGGVGKTTVSALLTRALIESGREPVLAIDADPNSCLDAALGVKAEHTVGRAREDVRQEAGSGQAAGIAKRELLQLKIAESLVEARGFDLIAMGRPEGAGCYCYANNVLKEVIGEIAGAYPYVVLDNEAGLENLSRRIVRSVDLLVLVSDASNAGIETLKRLHALAQEMEIKFGRLAIIVNRVRSGLPAAARELAAECRAAILLGLPDDGEVADLAERSGSLFELPEDNAVYVEIKGLAEKLL